MDAARKEALRRRLTEELSAARETVAAQSSDQQAISPDNAIGRISRMDAMYSQQLSEGALRRAKERLAKLEYVLERLDSEDFGICEFCRQPIAPARLEAMPEGNTCINCAAFA